MATDQSSLAEQFEAHRAHLRGVAFRMLGSLPEADDAVQEAWLRFSGADSSDVSNLGGWLTTIVARICLDTLRSRESRREEPLDDAPVVPAPSQARLSDPEQEAVLADSVGLALLVVLDTLSPAERVAFVLHDMFDIPFDDIAPMLGRTPVAARQLASRARRRVSGRTRRREGGPAVAEQRATIEAFLAALRAGDLEALLAVLDPDLVVEADAAVAGAGAPRMVRGAAAWARQAVEFRRGVEAVQPALIDGAVGLVFAPGGTPRRFLRFTVAGRRIQRIEIVGGEAELAKTHIEVLAAGGA